MWFSCIQLIPVELVLYIYIHPNSLDIQYEYARAILINIDNLKLVFKIL